MKTLRLTALAAFALMLTPNAFPCEFHDGYGTGAFGIEWRPYNPSGEYNDFDTYKADEDESSSADTEKKARPVFSSSVIRASDSAKARVAENKTDEESSEESTGTE